MIDPENTSGLGYGAVGIAFGPDGNLYVSDYTGEAIRRYDGLTGAANGDFTTGVTNTYHVAWEPAVQVNIVPNSAPVVSLVSSPLSYLENDPATVMDSGATVSDVDPADLDTGTLTVSVSVNASTNDDLTIRPG